LVRQSEALTPLTGRLRRLEGRVREDVTMDGPATLRVSLLNTFQAVYGDAVVPIRGTRLRALTVRLALAGGHPVEPTAMISAIWADDPPAGAGHALHALVSRLRRILGSPDGVTQVSGGYRLAVDAAEVDALRFEQLAATGRDRLRAADPTAAAASLGEAMTLWAGRPGTEPAIIATVAPAVATRLAHLSLETAVDLAEAEIAAGHAELATGRLTDLLTDHPVHERAAAALMDALAVQGRQAEALTWYERVREALADDLGADPGAALRERHLGLLRPPAVARTSEPSNLPAPLTSFVGRGRDLARVEALLTTGRLATVLGPGGCGKTRLAVEATRRLRHEYRDGCWMIDLASVTEPAKVEAAVLAAIGLRGNGLFDTRGRAEGLLVERLRDRECLLLIDNCEHLIESVAQLTGTLLSRCPELRILATSREPLAVDGEALVPLGPLELPAADDDADRAGQTDAVRLFTERAGAVRPGFTLDAATLPDIRRVVRGLDGLPLALELAAARLRTISLPELSTRLSDRFRLLSSGGRTAVPRHRTLRAVIDWSWDLLSEEERLVAEHVSVLPGGVTTASATAVCAGTKVSAADIRDLLAALVDRSLLQLAPEPGRYRMLETLREYGTERLTEAGRLHATRGRAAGHLTRLMLDHDPRLRGRGQLAAIEVIRADYDNALAALRWRCDSADASGAITLAVSLIWFWQLTGRSLDAAYWLSEALAVPGGEPGATRACVEAAHLLSRANARLTMSADQAAEDRARMREVAAQLLRYTGLPSPYAVFGPVLLTFLEEQSAAVRFAALAESDDEWLSGLAHLFLAQIAENAGEPDSRRAHVDAALARFGHVDDRWGRAAALPIRAQLRQYDDLDGAGDDLRKARSLAEEFGALSLSDQVDSDLRWIDLHLRRNDFDEALKLFGALSEKTGHAPAADLVALIAAREAEAWLQMNDAARAEDLLHEAEQALTGNNRDHVRTLVACTRSAVLMTKGDVNSARRELTAAHAAAQAVRDLPILSVVAVHSAALAAAAGRHEQAAVLLGAAARLRGAHDRTDPRIRELSSLGQVALGPDGYAAAYRQGWEFTRRQAMTEADPANLRTGAGPFESTDASHGLSRRPPSGGRSRS
jgi:predicted ATPase/DNA-binding SARP family transcriptional activator